MGSNNKIIRQKKNKTLRKKNNKVIKTKKQHVSNNLKMAKRVNHNKSIKNKKVNKLNNKRHKSHKNRRTKQSNKINYIKVKYGGGVVDGDGASAIIPFRTFSVGSPQKASHERLVEEAGFQNDMNNGVNYKGGTQKHELKVPSFQGVKNSIYGPNASSQFGNKINSQSRANSIHDSSVNTVI